MPLYEWECLACEIRFEELAPVSDGRLERSCPSCGRLSPRVVSSFAIASGASPEPQSAAAGTRNAQAPICLRYPHIPLLCHMDKPTAERAVAYAQGRGAEHDDRKGQAEETRKKRGFPHHRLTRIFTIRAAIRPPPVQTRTNILRRPPRTGTTIMPRAPSLRARRMVRLRRCHRTAIDAALKALIWRAVSV
jgi:putative FmdB family regulatory protein